MPFHRSIARFFISLTIVLPAATVFAATAPAQPIITAVREPSPSAA
jgi:hypothetical protein